MPAERQLVGNMVANRLQRNREALGQGSGGILLFCSLFVTPWTRARQALLSSTASQSWVKLMLVALMTLSNHLVLCHPLLLLPSHFPNIRVFSRESCLLMRWAKDWSFSFRICPSGEHSGLISFRTDRSVSYTHLTLPTKA